MKSTDPKLYAIELGQHKCRDIITELVKAKNKATGELNVKHNVVTGCELYQGKLTNDGHWQIQRKPRYITRPSQRVSISLHRAYYVHRIAYVALHGTDPILTASHRCGNGNCINPFHIYDESIDLNVARINCLGFVECGEHGHRLVTLCQHQPPCIKKPILADSCCFSTHERDGTLGPDVQSSEPKISQFDDWLYLSPTPPSSGEWLCSSQELFDLDSEIASPDASPPPPVVQNSIEPPLDFSPPSPLPWKANDIASESQQTSTSDFLPEDMGWPDAPVCGPSDWELERELFHV